MDAPHTELSVYGYLLAAIAHSVFALVLAGSGRWRRASGDASRLFIGAVAATALWAWSGLAIGPGGGSAALVNQLLDLLRYALWFAFLCALVWPAITPLRRPGIFGIAIAIAGVAFLVAASSVVSPALEAMVTKVRVGLLGHLALPVCGLVLVEQLFRNLDDDLRWNAKPVCLALSIVFFFDLYLFSGAMLFGRVDGDALSVRPAIQTLAVPLLLLAAKRRADWVSKLHVSRTAAFYSASLLLAGVYLLLVASIGYYVRFAGGEWGPALQVATLFVAIVFLAILVVSTSVRARLRVLVRKHFFHYRYDYREEWLRFTSMLSAKRSPQDMGVQIVKGLAHMLESPAGALWTSGANVAGFSQAARWNVPSVKTAEPVESALVRFLASTVWIIDLDQFRRDPHRYGDLELPDWITSRPDYWLIVPLSLPDELIGFVTLDRPRAPVDVNWEVTDLLKTAGRQAASYLDQMRATEALLEARKFDAFNRMSAFVVHDLKNIVTQLSLMMKNAQRLRDNAEFQDDMLATVESSLEKMRQLMLQLREGEARADGRSGVELAPIIRRIEAVAQERGRTLEVQLLEQVTTRGHEQRIERVIGHVVQNAFDATAPGDRVWVKLQKASGQARIEVGDTGQGMSDEYVRTRLFKPFQSTKTTGMGIGVYESLQYIKELGGQIGVDTKVNRGTIMTIVLPLFETRTTSDIQMASAK
jgi:putative PEP-CTERM system histidine kinase